MAGDVMARVVALGGDRESGASDLLDAAIGILRDAARQPDLLVQVAQALCRAQPSMASIWNAAIEAIASRDDPERFERFVQRVARAPRGLSRAAAACFPADGDAPRPLRLVTLSGSRTVVTVLDALRGSHALAVACSESRPALEGRRLAARIAAWGIPVTLFADAAIGHALDEAHAVIVGADALTPKACLNKSGTRMLAAAALVQGLPVYAAATRDKFVSARLAGRLQLREGSPAEIWDAPAPGVAVRNPYFEGTPLDLFASVISDIGLLGAGLVPDVCAAVHDEAAQRALDAL